MDRQVVFKSHALQQLRVASCSPDDSTPLMLIGVCNRGMQS